MLRQVPREFDQFGGELDGEFDQWRFADRAPLPDLHLVEALAPSFPTPYRPCRGHIFRQPQRLADVADRAARRKEP